jgi:hypothetical protein
MTRQNQTKLVGNKNQLKKTNPVEKGDIERRLYDKTICFFKIIVIYTSNLYATPLLFWKNLLQFSNFFWCEHQSFFRHNNFIPNFVRFPSVWILPGFEANKWKRFKILFLKQFQHYLYNFCSSRLISIPPTFNVSLFCSFFSFNPGNRNFYF